MKTAFNMNRNVCKKDSGFSLIEVLISALVLAIGVIGTAMIQIHAFRTSEQSNFHDTAVALAMQIADEIRANDEEARLTTGNPFEGFAYTALPTPPTGSYPVNCYDNQCTPNQLATFSKYEWQQKVFETLPSGRVEICRDKTVVDANGRNQWCSSSGGTDPSQPLVIKVGWYERDANGKAIEGNDSAADDSPRVALLISPYTR
jgi:type IV pilus assembly protein PilV